MRFEWRWNVGANQDKCFILGVAFIVAALTVVLVGLAKGCGGGA